MIEKLCVIGIGLIGGSLAKALKSAGACGEVVGCDRNEADLKKAVDQGIIDRYETAPEAAVDGADLVVVAVPVGAMKSVFTAIAPHLASNAVITDVGSTKTSVVLDADSAFGRLPGRFVPGHPIAGTERSGVDAVTPDLFQGRLVILSPLKETEPEAITKVQSMWERIGAEVRRMDVRHHDEVLAATSHLPHILAYTLVDVLRKQNAQEALFSGAAFRGVTRIASSDPGMWADICLSNRQPILNMLAAFSNELVVLANGIGRSDGDALMAIFSHAKSIRDQLEDLPADGTAEVDAEPSHALPHLLAFILVETLGRRGNPKEILQLAAGGFRDFTRIASSDPKAWADVCLANAESILQALASFGQDLAALANHIGHGDREALVMVFSRAKAVRDRHTAH